MKSILTPHTDASVFTKEPHPSSSHQLLIKQWSSSQSGSNNGRKGPDSVLFTHLSHSRGIQKISLPLSLSLWLLQSVLQWPWPECVWYYTKLNVGFTEATWIKRVAARMYLVLCNAVNRFAEWGFNVFPYTNIMSTSWNIIISRQDEPQHWLCLKPQVRHFHVSESLPPLVRHRYCINSLSYMDGIFWKYVLGG